MEEFAKVILLPQPANPAQNNLKSNQAGRAIFTFHNILVAIKLDEKNYTIWKHQISKFLHRLELEIYVLQGAPSYTPSDGSVDPKFKMWKKQDENLSCWLMSSMSEDMLKQISGFDTSRDAWIKLENCMLLSLELK